MVVIGSASGVDMESVFSFNVSANDAAWTWAARAWAFPNACSCLHVSLPGDWKTLSPGHSFKIIVCVCACVHVCTCMMCLYGGGIQVQPKSLSGRNNI